MSTIFVFLDLLLVVSTLGVYGSVPADGLVRLAEDLELQNTGFWRTSMSLADTNSPLY